MTICNFILWNHCNFPWASWWCDQLIGTKLVLVHNSYKPKIGDFWQYYFDWHRWKKWATEKQQLCGERKHSQLSLDNFGFSLAYLVYPWRSKQNCQKSPILMWNLRKIKIGYFLRFCFDRHGWTKYTTENAKLYREIWECSLSSHSCYFSVAHLVHR